MGGYGRRDALKQVFTKLNYLPASIVRMFIKPKSLLDAHRYHQHSIVLNADTNFQSHPPPFYMSHSDTLLP